MQLQRLFEIVYILLNQKKISAKQLAEKFEVSTRTIYRDIDVLSMAGIPIYTEKGKHGGICLLEDFVMNKSMITEEEQQQILLSLQSLGKLESCDITSTLNKLGSFFQKKVTNWIEVDFSDWGASEVYQQQFAMLKEAILNRKVVEFVYYNSNKEAILRKVEPLQLYFKNKAWYVKGYCRKKQDFRTFKISRIQDLEITEETFERKELSHTIVPKQSNIPLVTLKLKIRKEASYRVLDEYPMDSMEQTKSGDFIVTITFPENDWVYGYILSFGEDAEVIEPQYVRQQIKEKLEKNLSQYL